MKLEVPDEFVELLESLEKVWPKCLVNCLQWASKNPERARDVVKRYARLGKRARRDFLFSINIGDDPLKAIKVAEKWSGMNRRMRSKIGRIAAAAKKDGYRMKLKNGVPCVVKKDENGYRFDFTVAGSVISILYKGLSSVIDSLNGTPPSVPYGGEVRCNGQKVDHENYPLYYKAVEQNLNPEIVALMEGGPPD